jgi:integrase
LLQIEPEKPKTPGISFGQACERYLAAKSRKRSLENDTRIVKHLKAELGADTPLGEITARRIGEYRSKRLAAVRTVGAGEKTTERPLTAAAINRPLALLRHLLEAKLDDFHFHDLRRSFASWYIMGGGNPVALQRILGHADRKIDGPVHPLGPRSSSSRDAPYRAQRSRCFGNSASDSA